MFFRKKKKKHLRAIFDGDLLLLHLVDYYNEFDTAGERSGLWVGDGGYSLSSRRSQAC